MKWLVLKRIGNSRLILWQGGKVLEEEEGEGDLVLGLLKVLGLDRWGEEEEEGEEEVVLLWAIVLLNSSK